jgi:hypothetical protein
MDKVYLSGKCCCVYCGLDGLSDMRIWFNLSIDHLVPLPKEHPDRDSEFNLVVACNGCNGMKSSFDPSGQLRAALSIEEKEVFIGVAKRNIQRKRAAKNDSFRSHGGTPPDDHSLGSAT